MSRAVVEKRRTLGGSESGTADSGGGGGKGHF